MTKFLRYILVLFLAVLFNGITLLAQETEEHKKDSIRTLETLTIDEISNETETLRSRISSLKEVLKPSTQTAEVDSIIDTTYIEITIKRDSLYSQMEDISRRELKIRKISWDNYKSKLKKLQVTLQERASDITDVSKELTKELTKWNATKSSFKERSESENVFASLDTMITTLNSLIETSHVRLDSIFSVQKQLTELVLTVDEALSEINRVEHRMQKNYFVLDSDPLWISFAPDSATSDTTQPDTVIAENRFIKGINNDITEFQKFFVLNLQTSIFQVGFLILFLVVIILMRKRWISIKTSSSNPLDVQTKTIFNNPIAATLVVGTLITVYFYEAIIPVYGEAHMLVILLATIALLPRVTTPKIRVFLILLLAAYFIEITDVYFEPRSTLVRWLLILEAAILFIALVLGRKTVLQHPLEFQKITTLFRFVIPIYQLTLLIAIIINIVGMVNLSAMLTYGVMFSVALGMVISLAIKVVTSIMVLFFKLRKSGKVQALSLMVEATNQRFQPALVGLGMILWLLFTLRGFDVYGNIVEWVYSLLEVSWDLGDMKISLGSILSFFTLLIITLIIAKILSAIFQDEWMIQTLPRGVAPAISILLRIFVIAIGLYLAFTSAGSDLSELGFIFGALGVGIGFGLQNVVLNFIAGLILAFERPINLGDAIEIDNETGVVTSIGVRSSNIRTWSGAEAIIPNGDLISKKVINWTLTDRNRRSKILMRTAASANPDTVIALFNEIASQQESVYKDPAPKTYFYGYGEDGNLMFALLYWTSFSDTLKIDNDIALLVYKALKDAGIEAPMPNQRNFG